VGQSGLRAALTANDQEIVRLSQRRAVMAGRAASQPQNQQLQAQLAGIDQVIANFTGDRSRLLIQAGTLGLATVIDQPGLPARPESKAAVQKLGLAGLLGLVAGILIASIAETMRPTVPGARRVSRRLSVPALGQLSGADLNGGNTPALGELALRCRLAAAHADLRTVALVDIDGKRDLAALAAALTQSLQVSPADGGSADGGSGRSGLAGRANGSQHWDADNEPTLAGVSPSVLVKSISQVAENRPAGHPGLQVYPLGQMTWVTGTRQVGIIVLSGPVARVSRILALEDLSRSSGWPIIGVVGVPRMRRRWRGRRAQPPAPGAEAGADNDAEGLRR
jgi:hypothetical protein